MFRSVAFVGSSEPGAQGVLTSPLTGTPCVWFKLRVESWQAHADLHHRHTVHFQQSGSFVVDGTLVSASVIRSDGPPLRTVVETVSGKRPPTRDSAPLLHRLADDGLVPLAALARRAHLLDEIVWETTEVLLIPGQRVRVSGRLSRRDGQSVLRHSLLGSGLDPA